MKKIIFLFCITFGLAQNNGIRSLNGSLNNSQRLTVDTVSSATFRWGLSNGVHTLYLPYRIVNPSGSSFKWNVSGQTAKYDSLRLIAGSNVSLTQSGNTVTIATSGGGSVGNADSLGGVPASDYVTTNTAQTISGAKSFTDSVGITTSSRPNLSLRKNASVDGRYIHFANTETSPVGHTWAFTMRTLNNNFNLYNSTKDKFIFTADTNGFLTIGNNPTASSINSLLSLKGSNTAKYTLQNYRYGSTVSNASIDTVGNFIGNNAKFSLGIIGEYPTGDLLTVDNGSVRGGITVIGYGDATTFNDIKQRVDTATQSSYPDTAITEWQWSMRKDGRFSEDYSGFPTMEVYAHLKAENYWYYAPLLLKSNGDVTLVGSRQDIVGGYVVRNGVLNVGEAVATNVAKLSLHNDIRKSKLMSFYNGLDNEVIRIDSVGQPTWYRSSLYSYASLDTFGRVGLGRTIVANSMLTQKNFTTPQYFYLAYNSRDQLQATLDSSGLFFANTVTGTSFGAIASTGTITGTAGHFSDSVGISTNRRPNLTLRKNAGSDGRFLRFKNTETATVGHTYDINIRTLGNMWALYNDTKAIGIFGVDTTGRFWIGNSVTGLSTSSRFALQNDAVNSSAVSITNSRATTIASIDSIGAHRVVGGVTTAGGFGNAPIVDTVLYAGVSSSLSARNLPSTAGTYRLSYNLATTTAGSGGTVTMTISYNNGAAQTNTRSILCTTTSLASGGVDDGVILYRVTSGTPTIATTYTGTGGAVYYVDATIERLK